MCVVTLASPESLDTALAVSAPDRDLSLALERLSRVARLMFQADSVALFLSERSDPQLLRAQVVDGPLKASAALFGRTLLPDRGIATAVFQSGIDSVVADVPNHGSWDDRFDGLHSDYQTKTLLTAVVYRWDRKVGVLQFVNPALRPDCGLAELRELCGLYEQLLSGSRQKRMLEMALPFLPLALRGDLERQLERSGNPVVDRVSGSVLYADLVAHSERFEDEDDSRAGQEVQLAVSEMITSAHFAHGDVLQYAGDSIMAVFYDDKAVGDRAEQSLRCAQDVLRRIGQLGWQGRVAIENGVLTGGTLGPPERRFHSYLGAAANDAHALLAAFNAPAEEEQQESPEQVRAILPGQIGLGSTVRRALIKLGAIPSDVALKKVLTKNGEPREMAVLQP